jgi:hypothetical protein
MMSIMIFCAARITPSIPKSHFAKNFPVHKEFAMASTNLFDLSPDVPLQAATDNKRPYAASELVAAAPKTGRSQLASDNKRPYTASELVVAIAPKTERSQLGVDFQPSNLSVICGRGKKSYNHTGNLCFRILTTTFVERYSRAESKTAKSTFVYNIVTLIREAGGHFCKYEKGAWFDVGDRVAREKVSSLFRDMLHTQYRSSAKAKINRRGAQNRN